jgi:hypothetical protein
MSEKVYAWLLRLYPSHFCEAYGDAALQLFRDRWRDERGLLPRLRLWLDLLADLAISVPRQHHRVQPALIGSTAGHRSDGVPLFHTLESESPGLGALLLGSALSLVALGASISVGHLQNHHTIRVSLAHSGVSQYAWRPAWTGPAPQAAIDAESDTIAFGPPTKGAGSLRRRDAAPMFMLIASQRLLQQSAPQGAPATTIEAAVEELKLDVAERRRVIDAVIANLKQYYVSPDAAKNMADALLAHEKTGDYDAIADGARFAALLTTQLRDVSHDMHLEVVYSKAPLPDPSAGPTPERFALYRKAMEEHNCTFENVELLPHNIGYLKLNSFPDPSICQPTATAAMATLNRADALIFDLRDNRGGYPGMVSLLAAYLFDHPEYLYSPRENTTEESWTRSPVPGNRLADKPVYVLTSARTFSGAEHFSYNLKMLKRATLVGETTGGATDVGTFHRIDDHFGMGIREARAINPYAESDWAGKGVEPNVKVKAADALATAEKLLQLKRQKK